MTRNRCAFTLVELLVVITIIGILLSLMIPAIYGRIKDAQRMRCLNNLRQITIATSGYALQRGQYPGCLNLHNGRVAPWPVAVAGNFGRVDLANAWNDPAVADADLPRVVLDILQCPSNPPQIRSTPQLSFVASAGASSAVPQSPANGVLLDRSAGSSAPALGPTNIVDGAASTLLFSENVQATAWHIAQKNDVAFVWHPTTTPATEMLINRGMELPLSENTARPSSRHSGGVNASFCDDHARFLSEQIDYKVYMQLITPNAAQSDMPVAWKSYHLDAADMH